MSKARVGIEKITAYPTQLSLNMEELCLARKHDPAHPRDVLWVSDRSLNPVWEDPVTMGVNAALQMLSEEDREQIELIVFGSESSVDFGKPMSTYVQRFCGIGANARNFETKHACYGGSAALMMAAHWVASGYNRGKKALVVCADQSRMHLGQPWEYVLGAAATAMLVSDQPDVLELELEHNGYWTNEIHDTYRPTAHAEVGHADTSLYGYLEALEGSYDHFLERLGEEIDYDAAFKKHIYHVPFGGMTLRAHKALLRRQGLKARAIRENFERKSKPALRYNGQVGGSYTSATFLAMMGLIDSSEDLNPGDRISIYTYGSGSCAEFYTARIGERAKEVVAAQGFQAGLDARQRVSVAEYESIEKARTANIDQPNLVTDKSGLNGLYERRYAGKGLLVLDHIDDWERHYRIA